MAKSAKNTFFTVAFIGLVAWFLLKQSVRIDVGTPSVSYLAAKGNGLTVNIKLPILNRSDLSYPIEGFLGQLRYQENVIGNVMLKNPVTIPARSSANTEFVATIDWGSLASQTYDFLNQGGVINWLLKKVGLPTGSTNPAEPSVKIDWTKFNIHGTLYVGGVAVDIDQNLV